MGSNCLPSKGIGAVADQMAAALPSGSVTLGEWNEYERKIPYFSIESQLNDTGGSSDTRVRSDQTALCSMGQGCADLINGSVSSGAKVESVEGKSASGPARAVLSDGSSVSGRKGVVVAVQGPEATRLLGPAIRVRIWKRKNKGV